MIDIHPKKVAYLNQEAQRLALLLQTEIGSKEKPTTSPEKGSVTHLVPQVINDIENFIITAHDEPLVFKRASKGMYTGFDAASYQEFKKLVAAAEKETAVNTRVSTEFVKDKSFHWMLDTHNGETTQPYCEYLSQAMDDASSIHRVCFPVANLHIGARFVIGNVEFTFFTKEYFDAMANAYAQSDVADEFPDETLREQYQGRVLATYLHEAEMDKAVEIAFDKCALAIDVLKVCSRALVDPAYTASFDIDTRLKQPPTSEVLVTNPNDIMSLTIITRANQVPYEIGRREWDQMQDRGLVELSDFLLTLDSSPNELRELIARSITRSASALSNKNLHQRVVELFTVLESLLLKNESASIQESVSKYLSLIAFTHKEDRIECDRVVKTMYKVRSALIHHGKEIDFEINDLLILQLCVSRLLQTLIEKADSHTNKHSVLTEVDDLIFGLH